MYAIIKTSGKQYKISENDIISVNKLPVNEGDKVEFKEILLVNNDGDLIIGTPFVEGAVIEGEAVKQFRDKKINGYIYKAKKDWHKHYGHRQDLTAVKINKISLA